MDSFSKALLSHCKVSCRHNYFDILQKFYAMKVYDEGTVMVLLDAGLAIERELCTAAFTEQLKLFLKESFGAYSKSVDIAVLKASRHYFDGYGDDQYEREDVYKRQGNALGT